MYSLGEWLNQIFFPLYLCTKYFGSYTKYNEAPDFMKLYATALIYNLIILRGALVKEFWWAKNMI